MNNIETRDNAIKTLQEHLPEKDRIELQKFRAQLADPRTLERYVEKFSGWRITNIAVTALICYGAWLLWARSVIARDFPALLPYTWHLLWLYVGCLAMIPRLRQAKYKRQHRELTQTLAEISHSIENDLLYIRPNLLVTKSWIVCPERMYEGLYARSGNITTVVFNHDVFEYSTTEAVALRLEVADGRLLDFGDCLPSELDRIVAALEAAAPTATFVVEAHTFDPSKCSLSSLARAEAGGNSPLTWIPAALTPGAPLRQNAASKSRHAVSLIHDQTLRKDADNYFLIDGVMTYIPPEQQSDEQWAKHTQMLLEDKKKNNNRLRAHSRR